jgi:hypothetical protein
MYGESHGWQQLRTEEEEDGNNKRQWEVFEITRFLDFVHRPVF